jgi:hypothetical protein
MSLKKRIIYEQCESKRRRDSGDGCKKLAETSTSSLWKQRTVTTIAIILSKDNTSMAWKGEKKAWRKGGGE